MGRSKLPPPDTLFPRLLGPVGGGGGGGGGDYGDWLGGCGGSGSGSGGDYGSWLGGSGSGSGSCRWLGRCSCTH